ncbi:MAG TPA: MFS transporter [Ktedonobacterales bacterium]|nr:MFS transporter [Ktedonobacterales bacterium]
MSDVSERPVVSAAPKVSHSGAGVYAWYVFWLMCGLNFINYVDRFIFTAVSPAIETQLNFNDLQYGLVNSAFLIVYSLVAFPLGYLAERFSRKVVVGAGVTLWSLATLLTGRANSLGTMYLARSAVGIGEGSYYPSGTPLLAAWFPANRRASILAWWGSSALVGAGIGTVFGGFFNHPDSWRTAFYISAVPGLILGLLMFFLRERVRSDEDPEVSATFAVNPIETIKRCWKIRTFRVILFQHALGFFALASAAAYLVLYVSDTYGVKSGYGPAALGATVESILPGGILVVGGIAGGIYGGAWANRMRRTHIGARVRTGGVGFLVAAPFLAAALGAPYALRLIPAYIAAPSTTQVTIGVAAFAVMALGAAFFLNVYNGPTSAALQDVLPPNLRAAGGGLELTLAHILGDIYAPTAIGGLSVLLGSALGGHQIGLALLITCPFTLIGAGVIGIWGSKFYRADVEVLGVSAESMVGSNS